MDTWNASASKFVQEHLRNKTVWDGLVVELQDQAIDFTAQNYKELDHPINGQQLERSRAKQIEQEQRRIKGWRRYECHVGLNSFAAGPSNAGGAPHLPPDQDTRHPKRRLL
jgi:hypothetical protein